MTKPLSVFILGCGNIGGGFDLQKKLSEFSLTHAAAFSQDKRFIIKACFDPDIKKLRLFNKKWGPFIEYQSIDQIDKDMNYFDVISICSPTSEHPKCLDIAIKLKPKLIFCEKPLTQSVQESLKFISACKKNNILLAVNYSRRFDKTVQNLAIKIKEKKWGELRVVNGIYNKGLLNNGSHMIDLLIMLLGVLKIQYVGDILFDYEIRDPSVSLILKSQNNVPINISSTHSKDYSLFELQFIFSKAILSMENGGLNWRIRSTNKSKVFKGYITLNSGYFIDGTYFECMKRAVNNIFYAINNNKPLMSDGDSSIASHRLIKKILDRLHKRDS
jgi:predicted dehydrogenase